MRDLRPALIRLQSAGAVVRTPSGVKTLHWKGLLTGRTELVGSANWTRNSSESCIERCAVLHLSAAAAAREAAAIAEIVGETDLWDPAQSTPLRSSSSRRRCEQGDFFHA
jgi:hypothetical protein